MPRCDSAIHNVIWPMSNQKLLRDWIFDVHYLGPDGRHSSKNDVRGKAESFRQS